MKQTDPGEHLFSVVIPTHNRIPQLLQLLEALGSQTVPTSAFDVIVCDDGSTDPVGDAVRSLETPYPLTFLTQENRGPAAARNRAIERVRGRLTLILNDDAVPDADLLRVHLAAHVRRRVPLAVLGSFPYVAESLARPFVRLMEETDLNFAFVSMRGGQLYDWRHFWTCNISLPTHALNAVDGFDERFPDPMCEDLELGYRLGRLGIPVLYLPEARCFHDHDLDPDRFVRRAVCLGRNLIRLCEIHPEPEVFRTWGIPDLEPRTLVALQHRVDEGTADAARDLDTLREADRAGLPATSTERLRLLDTMGTAARRLSEHHCRRGMIEEWTRRHGVPVLESRPVVRNVPHRALTSIVIPCIDGYEHTRACLDSIAAHTPEPHEVIVVDNGSSAATLTALRECKEIVLLEMGRNVGAPAARNRGIEASCGNAFVFLDNDTRVTPGWLSRFVAHAAINPRVGLVGPMSNTVSGTQLVEDPEYDPERLDAYATRFTAERAGRHHYTRRLILFCLWVRRDVIDQIGGFDPAFGRWGFEDDDFCLRAALAGYRLRVAEDMFVHHTGSRTSIAAAIDYSALLATNWNVFKEKWRIDGDLPYGAAYPLERILAGPFDPKRHVVPLEPHRSGALR